MSEILTTEEFRAHTAGNCGCCQGNAECADVPGSDGCCHDADDRRHSLMTISEWESGCDCHTMMRHDAALRADIARLTRERDEARERAASLSRELLTAIRARDSYRASAELRVGMRREIEEILGCGDTTGEEAFERGLIRLRGLLAAESRAARLLTALKQLLKAFLMLHRACGTGSAEQWPEVEDARAAIAAEEGK